MRRFRKLFLLFIIATLVAVVPFLILGESFEQEIKNWFQQEWSLSQRYWLIVGLLSSDILLPIPSSAVSTYGGSILGFVTATSASWLGMMVGALLGFSIARVAGPTLVRRLTNMSDLTTLERLNSKFSLWTIILTRPLPILSEAAILLMGSLKLSWMQLMLPLSLSNLMIAVCYSAIGAWSVQQDLTFIVIVSSMFVPLAATWMLRRRFRMVSSP